MYFQFELEHFIHTYFHTFSDLKRFFANNVGASIFLFVLPCTGFVPVPSPSGGFRCALSITAEHPASGPGPAVAFDPILDRLVRELELRYAEGAEEFACPPRGGRQRW